MKCPKEIRQCPNGWNDCNLCAHDEACRAGTYVPELEDNELEVDLGIPIVGPPPVQEVQPRTVSIRGTWAEHFLKMSERARWNEYGKYQVPHINSKEPVKAMAGAIVPGGGGKCKIPRKPARKMPEYLKNWGNEKTVEKAKKPS